MSVAAGVLAGMTYPTTFPLPPPTRMSSTWPAGPAPGSLLRAKSPGGWPFWTTPTSAASSSGWTPSRSGGAKTLSPSGRWWRTDISRSRAYRLDDGADMVPPDYFEPVDAAKRLGLPHAAEDAVAE